MGSAEGKERTKGKRKEKLFDVGELRLEFVHSEWEDFINFKVILIRLPWNLACQRQQKDEDLASCRTAVVDVAFRFRPQSFPESSHSKSRDC